MPERLYIRPIALAASPQSEEGPGGIGAVRLAGGLVWASRFALIRRRAGRVISRERVDVPDMAMALARLPDELAQEGAAQWAALRREHAPLVCGARRIPLDQPQVLGILNTTPDSFSDGGRYSGDAAVAHAQAMLAAGAAIIDVGGESTRPGAAAVWEGDELARVIPVIERLAAGGAAISVDTRRVAVMAAALAAGAHVLNDVSALRHDPRSVEFAARAAVPVVLMHAPGSGEDLHRGGSYTDVVLDVFDWLRARRDAALAAGIAPGNIILDPGIGFGKSLSENLALMNALELFHALGCPLLVGASRKRMIGALAGEAPADKRLGGSVMLAVRAAAAGAQLIRVHDVPETVQALQVWRGLRDAALTDFTQLPD
jgi:dihydropteroate synthase